MNNTTIVFVMLIILVLLVSALKLFHSIYSRSIKQTYNSNNKINIEKPSYNKYKKVANKLCSKNAPKRKFGDFFDYIFYDSKKHEDVIENNILGLYGEDCNE